MSHEELVRVRQPDPSMEEIKDAAMKSTSKGNPSLGSVVDIINSKWMMDNRQPTNVPAVERVFDANKPPKLTWKQIVRKPAPYDLLHVTDLTDRTELSFSHFLP